MFVKDKVGIKELISSNINLTLDLGCGNSKHQFAIGIDKVDLDGVDLVGDVLDCLALFPDSCVQKIYCFSFFAHVDDFEKVLSEINRVLVDGGSLISYVPHFTNPFIYSDYTAKNYFGIYTFYYFAEVENQRKRKVPNHYSSIRFKITSLKLVFDSQYLLIFLAKKLFQKLVNFNSFTQDFYEENLSSFIPCYGMLVSLKSIK